MPTFAKGDMPGATFLKPWESGGLPMIFPTFSALRTLADFDSLDRLFAEYRVC